MNGRSLAAETRHSVSAHILEKLLLHWAGSNTRPNTLADLLIPLRRGIDKEGCGLEGVKAEPDRFIELLFRGSEAYRLALKLYAGRYEVIALRDAADILREVIARHMPEDDEQTESESE